VNTGRGARDNSLVDKPKITAEILDVPNDPDAEK
jgi:hypothetical protein